MFNDYFEKYPWLDSCYNANFVYNEKVFVSTYQCYLYEKAKYHNEHKLAEQIISTSSIDEMISLDDKIKVNDKWLQRSNCIKTMYHIICNHFKEETKLYYQLLVFLGNENYKYYDSLPEKYNPYSICINTYDDIYTVGMYNYIHYVLGNIKKIVQEKRFIEYELDDFYMDDMYCRDKIEMFTDDYDVTSLYDFTDFEYVDYDENEKTVHFLIKKSKKYKPPKNIEDIEVVSNDEEDMNRPYANLNIPIEYFFTDDGTHDDVYEYLKNNLEEYQKYIDNMPDDVINELTENNEVIIDEVIDVVTPKNDKNEEYIMSKAVTPSKEVKTKNESSVDVNIPEEFSVNINYNDDSIELVCFKDQNKKKCKIKISF